MTKNILIVDDDPVGSTLVEARLSKAGLDVRVANTGQSGLNMIEVKKPDVIILDVEMPDINGYDFVLKLKSNEETNDIRVIMLTSHEENKPLFARKGIREYFVKPVNPDELIAAINHNERNG